MHVFLLSAWARSGWLCKKLQQRAKERRWSLLTSIFGYAWNSERSGGSQSSRTVRKQTPVLPPMPLLSRKLRSVAVGQDHVFSSAASNFLKEFVVARKSVLCANWRTCLARLAAGCFCTVFCVGSNIFHDVPVVQKANFGDPKSSVVLSAKTFSRSIAAISRASIVLATNRCQANAQPSVMSTAPALFCQHSFKSTVNANTASRRPMRGCDGEGAMNGLPVCVCVFPYLCCCVCMASAACEQYQHQ